MNAAEGPGESKALADAGLSALCGVSAYYRIPANPSELRRQLSLPDRAAEFPDLVRAAHLLGLKARWVRKLSRKRLGALPAPSLVRVQGGGI